MGDGSLETVLYSLASEEQAPLEVPRRFLEMTAAFFEACRNDPPLAREMLQGTEAFRYPAVKSRAADLVEIYEEAVERGITEEEAMQRFERRQGVSVYRDTIVLALCRRGLFLFTHEPGHRGEALESAFRMEEAIAPVLDRLDRECFRLRFARSQGLPFLGDEEWDDRMGGGGE
ncbi:MAG: hypothetical protein ACYTHM_18460 [Planctomycetota bacterium]